MGLNLVSKKLSATIYRAMISSTLLMSLAGCIVPLPFVGGGIAGAGMDASALRDAAHEYPEFRADNVRVGIPSDGALSGMKIDRNNYFYDFSDHVHVAFRVKTRMNAYQFQLNSSASQHDRWIGIDRNGEQIISELIPAAFYMGDLQAASMHIGGDEYLLLAANSRTSTHRRWFAIYRANGSKVYAASLSQHVAQVRQNQDGISLFFLSGDSMRIKLL